MHKRFVNLGFKVSMTRLDDTEVPWRTRGKRVAESDALLCISNHFNGFDSKAYGFETFYSIYAKPTWGNLIHKYVNEIGVTKNRGHRQKKHPTIANADYYFMHRTTGNTQTMIIEYFFGDVKLDVDNYREKRLQYLEAVIKATCEYCGVPYKEV